MKNSDVMLILWDPTWTETWKIFFQTAKEQKKGEKLSGFKKTTTQFERWAKKVFFFLGGRFDTCTAWLNLVDSFVVFRLFCSLLCGCYLSALLFKSGPNGTCVENKPTTAATKERLWCLFELAAFLKSKKTSSRKQTLIVRPIFLGPISIAVFVFCTAVCLPFLTVSFDNAVEGLLGVVVPAALVASFAAYPAVPRLSTFQKPLVEKTADNKQLETFQLWFFATLTFFVGTKHPKFHDVSFHVQSVKHSETSHWSTSSSCSTSSNSLWLATLRLQPLATIFNSWISWNSSYWLYLLILPGAHVAIRITKAHQANQCFVTGRWSKNAWIFGLEVKRLLKKRLEVRSWRF